MQADATVARKFLLAGATALPLGIASPRSDRHAGSIVTVIGLAVLIAGLIRSGARAPIRAA